jgi:RND family efflux transporter MFP subunit
VSLLKAGDEVNILVRAVSEEAFKGTIDSIVPSPQVGQTTYPVIIDFDMPVDALKPGMLSEVDMVTGKAENVVTVPSDAVIIREGKEIVCVLTAGNAVSVAEVVTGMDDGERVEIKSGLSPGDVVICKGQHYVDEDSKVNVSE